MCMFSFNPPWRTLTPGKDLATSQWNTGEHKIQWLVQHVVIVKKKNHKPNILLASEEYWRGTRVSWSKTWGRVSWSPELHSTWLQGSLQTGWAVFAARQTEPWIIWRQLLWNCLIMIGNWLVVSLIFSDKLLCLTKKICFLSYRQSINNCNCALLAILQDAEHISTLSKF